MAVLSEEEERSGQLTAQEYNALTRLVGRHARGWMSALLILSDLTALLLAGMLAAWLRTSLIASFDVSLHLKLLPLVLVYTGVFSWRRLYPAIGLSPVEELRRLVINTTLVFLVITSFAFVGQVQHSYSRVIFVFAWLFALVLLPLHRAVVRSVFVRLGLWGEPVVVIGPREKAAEISAILQSNPKIGLRPSQVCQHSTCIAGLGRAAFALPATGRDRPQCSRCPVCLAHVALVVYSDYSELEAARDKYRDTFQRVILVNYRDHGLNLSSTSVKEFGGLTGLEIHQNLLDSQAQFYKRVIDLFGSAAGLLLLAPCFALIALLIYLDSPGRIFYRQQRLGKDGRVFQLLKFRTMHLNADEVLKAYLEKDPALQQEWQLYQKLQNDPRITRVGKLLRRFSIDELPQLWNVLRGQMSLVGPRPIMLNQDQLYGALLDHYVRVTPGITGLWQVSGRNKTTFTRRAELDVHYVMNWSFWLDLYILVRTLSVVITRDGAS